MGCCFQSQVAAWLCCVLTDTPLKSLKMNWRLPSFVTQRAHTHTHTQPSRDDSQVHLNPYLNTSNTWLTHVWNISLNKLIDALIWESRSARWNRWSQPSRERRHILDNNFNYHCTHSLRRSNPLDAQYMVISAYYQRKRLERNEVHREL